MNCISYSLFGYNKNYNEGFPFSVYIRGLSFNIKMAELIYPGWKVHLTIDQETYDHFRPYIDYHVAGGRLNIDVVKYSELCEMMLQRTKPIFDGRYDRVLCRDIDSLLSYRERQAVEYWIQTGRIAHAITDSISHNIALMGGMTGFMCKQFREVMGVSSYADFVKTGPEINYANKGADQTFLNRYVLPKVANSIVEHYLLGLPQSFRGECHNFIQNIKVDLPRGLEESNLLTEHIGAAGFYSDAAILFFDKYFTQEQKDYYNKIEDQFKEIHYWRNENI